MFWVSCKKCSCNHGKSDLEAIRPPGQPALHGPALAAPISKGGIVMQQTDDAGDALDGGHRKHSPLVNILFTSVL